MLGKIIRRLTLLIIILILLMLVGFVFRFVILGEVGNRLIREDELQKSEVVFVLGGNSFDRGNEAAKLLEKGYGVKVVCLGENVPNVFKAIDKSYSEAEVTKINMVKNNDVLPRKIELLERGTSTKEEAEYIANYCEENQISSAIVVSSRFHTRRIQWVFRPLFDKIETRLIVHGAPSSKYQESRWWEEEQGLIMVNNEYVKLFYYWLKY